MFRSRAAARAAVSHDSLHAWPPPTEAAPAQRAFAEANRVQSTRRRPEAQPSPVLLQRSLAVALSCVLAAPALAQSNPEVLGRREAVERIISSALGSGEAYRMLTALCTQAPHRLAGSTGAAAAVEWARQEMEQLGFDNVRLEACTVPHWERGEIEELKLITDEGSQDLRILALGGSVATPRQGLEAEVVEVQNFEQLRALGERARGRIVFFNRPMDPSQRNPFSAYRDAVDQRSRGAIEASKAGAVAAVVRSMTMRLDDFPHTGAMRYEEGVERVPGVAISTLGAERLSTLLEQGKSVRLRLTLDCETYPDEPSFNVVGELVGSEHPEQVLVVGGHLDAWDVGQGAHDDGAGCVQAIEAVRLIRALDLAPRRTIRAVMFMNEENGVRGGNAYYTEHLEQMGQHVLAMESDRGGFTPRGFTSDAGPEAMAVLREIAELLRSIGIEGVFPGGGGVDISPMRASGVPQIGYLPDSQRYFDFHHCERDVLAAVHPRELELGAAAMAAVLYVVADLPETLPRNDPGSR